MIERMIGSLIPLVLAKIKRLELAQKKGFALFLRAICEAFLNDDTLEVSRLINLTEFPDDWKQALIEALNGADQGE